MSVLHGKSDRGAFDCLADYIKPVRDAMRVQAKERAAEAAFKEPALLLQGR